MPRHYQRAYANEHNQGGLQNAMLVGFEYRSAESVFTLAALGHENGVIVPLPENESGQYDIDYVEFDAEKAHYAEYPHPAHSHREKGDYREFKPSEGEPQEEEYYQRAGPAYIVEIVRKIVGKGAVHTRHVEAVGIAALHGLNVFRLHTQHVHHIAEPVGLSEILHKQG